MTTTQRYLASLLFMMTAMLILSGCEQQEDLQIAAAQECIDTARTSTDADRCYASVAGLESEKAYLIRCSSHYIAQGFTGSRFASAFQRLKDGATSGQDPMATAMAYMVFANSSTTHSADNAVTDCTRSGVRSMQRLATMTKLATFISNAGLGSIPDPSSPSFNPSQISTAITNLVNSNDPTSNASVGTIAQQASTAYCNEGSSFKDGEVCKNIQNAINAGGADTAAIGRALLQQLQSI